MLSVHRNAAARLPSPGQASRQTAQPVRVGVITPDRWAQSHKISAHGLAMLHEAWQQAAAMAGGDQHRLRILDGGTAVGIANAPGRQMPRARRR